MDLRRRSPIGRVRRSIYLPLPTGLSTVIYRLRRDRDPVSRVVRRWPRCDALVLLGPKQTPWSQPVGGEPIFEPEPVLALVCIRGRTLWCLRQGPKTHSGGKSRDRVARPVHIDSAACRSGPSHELCGLAPDRLGGRSDTGAGAARPSHGPCLLSRDSGRWVCDGSCRFRTPSAKASATAR
jgi:hypothetical protein